MNLRPLLLAGLTALALSGSALAQSTQAGSQRANEQASAREPQQYPGSVVRRAERALAEKQFVTGPIDGVLDPQTRYGLHNFQRAWDLATTGELNMETLAALGVDAPSASAGAGNRPADAQALYSPEIIRAVEQSLQSKNYVVGPVNSVIEPDTQYGLRQFQADYNLAPTGNLNFETLEALGIQFRQVRGQ